ncbi:hypothetical protein DT019_27215 [Streptomyces sp. SDr-06]|uniref:hypothetical protein n=1 Tax=Streptomyces sp. SDr-06 TaxID=2267702 RepID=UPI000DE843BA|nr:hypothetical protein [Streptomyces sp. SDr-06]RCH65487.1 hypothetical protein DT019_27215 [Streptomyces sp. SDr-06]
MNTEAPEPGPLRDVAQNPEATARYLADVQRVLLDIGQNLETLARETRVHLRTTHVEGDRFYHARLRALPVERALKDVLGSLNSLTAGLEKSAYKRHAHDEVVVNTARDRKEKELEKQRKKNPQPLQAAPNPPQGGAQSQNYGYGAPASIYDLGNRESA